MGMPAKIQANGTGAVYWTPDISQAPFQVGICIVPSLATATVDVTFDNIQPQDSAGPGASSIGTAAGSATWFNIIAVIGTGSATANFTTPVQAFRINVVTSVATGLVTVNFVQSGLNW